MESIQNVVGRAVPSRPNIIEFEADRIIEDNTCGICGGTGYVYITDDENSDRFGEVIRCSCNPAQIKPKSLALFDLRSGSLFDVNFENTIRLKHTAKAYDALKHRVELRRLDGFFTLIGGYGVGKTRLLLAGLNQLQLSGVDVIYTTAQQLLTELRNSFDQSGGYDNKTLVDILRNVSVLGVDEFGRQHETSYADAVMSQILDYRYNNNDRLTLFASNFRKEAIDPYLLSRMQDASKSEFFEIDGPDLRKVNW